MTAPELTCPWPERRPQVIDLLASRGVARKVLASLVKVHPVQVSRWLREGGVVPRNRARVKIEAALAQIVAGDVVGLREIL